MVAPDPELPIAAGHSILCLVGPTASGKTRLITQLAQVVPLEVISLDSRQIYRGLAVGTAQPSSAELALCPHHLVDFVDIASTYDAARYRQDFQAIYLDIRKRGKLPVVAGGAGMYLKSIQEGFVRLPGNAQENLACVRSQVEGFSPQELRARLGTLDPESADRLHPNDLYRQRRALEVFMLAGCSLTELISRQSPDPCLGLDFKVAVLEPSPADLDQKIQSRLEQMLEDGWLEETRSALAQYGPRAPGLRSIGYGEVILFLQGQIDKEELTSRIFHKTRQYAKRQRTWFRKTPAFLRGDPQDSNFIAHLKTAVRG